jgi:hypothetical protein
VTIRVTPTTPVLELRRQRNLRAIASGSASRNVGAAARAARESPNRSSEN